MTVDDTEPCSGDDIGPGDTIYNETGDGAHTVAYLSAYPGRFIGPDGEDAWVLHFTDGHERTIRGRGHYHRLRVAA